MIESQPQTPTMVIESQRKRDADHEQNCDCDPLVKIAGQQASEIHQHNQGFGDNHIYQNCAHKESFFAVKDYVAHGAALFDIERLRDNRSLAARRTAQFEATPQRDNDRAWISPHLNFASLA
jgi:hypothetical protein